MAARRGRRKHEDEGDREDWKHVLPVAGLIGAVAITLIIGAALKADSRTPAIKLEETAPEPEVSERVPGPAAASTAPVDLDQRARRDLQRIREDAAAWTLQFMLACDPANIRPRVEQLTEQPEFYLLPKMHDGRSCYRLCWGRFRTREQALAATSFPADLREITGRPQALAITGVVP